MEHQQCDRLFELNGMCVCMLYILCEANQGIWRTGELNYLGPDI